jgi:arylsulfatase A
MKRRDFVKAAGLMAGVVAGNQAFGASILSTIRSSGKKQNIVFILADDLGIGDVGCYGADNYKTPNIDKLAKDGVRFTHSYTVPLCGPSRAAILTGRYAFRTGAVNQDMTGLMKPSVETFMPKILKSEGYVTASIGKWGQLPLTPADFGFDEYLTFQGSGVYWNTQEKAKQYTRNGKKIPLKDKEYMPDLMHAEVVNFLTRHHDHPFYLYYSLSHVHAEILPTPDSALNSKDVYADNIAYMDKLVGKLIAELERQKLRENTMVMFVGDNGTGGGYANVATIGGRRLSGQKGSMLEGGALVPMIINWPGTTPAGKINTDMIDSTDFVPTFAALTGAKLPTDRVVDGRSFLPQVRGEQGKKRDWIFIELGKHWYVRERDWKLNEAGELFDMSKAPFEEPVIPVDTKDPGAIAARKRLQAALAELNPAGGILDTGDGTGRHANRKNKD